MRIRFSTTFLGGILLVSLASARSAGQDRASQMLQTYLRAYDPRLLIQAEERGLFSREQFPVLREVNPYYIRGDFNGDGGQDVAVWITDSDRKQRGVAIFHSTLDTVYVYGAGRPRPKGGQATLRQLSSDTWHLLSPGYVEPHPFGDIPEIGLEYGKPFTFERETIEFHILGKSAFVIYWANGQYWEFWTAD